MVRGDTGRGAEFGLLDHAAMVPRRWDAEERGGLVGHRGARRAVMVPHWDSAERPGPVAAGRHPLDEPVMVPHRDGPKRPLLWVMQQIVANPLRWCRAGIVRSDVRHTVRKWPM